MQKNACHALFLLLSLNLTRLVETFIICCDVLSGLKVVINWITAIVIEYVWSQYDGGNIEQITIGYGCRQNQEADPTSSFCLLQNNYNSLLMGIVS